MSWIVCTLDDICDKVDGHIQTGPFGSQLHQSDYSEVGTPVVMPKDIVNGTISEEGIARVSEEHVLRLSRHKVRTGDILFSRRGDVGRCAYISPKEQGWLCGTGCLRVTVDAKVADSKFIFYYLQQASAIDWIEKHAIGATMLNLNTGILANVPIMLPDLPTQHRIASILSAYDDLIENNRRQIKLLEEAAQRLYREWFVELRFPGHESVKVVDGVPEGWMKGTFDDICIIKKDALTPDKISPGMPYIGLEHIPRNDICLADWGMSEEVNSNKFRFSAGDILFGKIRPYFHKVGFTICSGICSTDSIVMNANDEYYCLLLMTASSDEFVDYTYQTCKEGAKMPRADWNTMKMYPVLIPDSVLLRRFNKQISAIKDKCTVLALQNRQLTEARDRLLPKLINGEMEV